MSEKHYAGRNLKIVNIHRGKGLREKYIYAELVDADTGELLIGATLEYIIKAIEVRF